MRIDFWQLSRLIFRAQQVLSIPGRVPRGDAGLYLLSRSLCEQLERTNPGIAGETGFEYAVNTLQNLPSTLPRVPLDEAEPTEMPLGQAEPTEVM